MSNNLNRPRLFFLTVGINKYPAAAGNSLVGCVQDSEMLEAYFRENYANYDPQIESLRDTAATRCAFVDGIRDHLGQARDGDYAILHYSGHGSRQKSAPEFKPFFPQWT